MPNEGADIDAVATALRMNGIPACVSLGMVLCEDRAWAGGSIDSRLPASQGADGAAARGALLVLADQALASGIFVAQGSDNPMMTLDLRVDWLAMPPIGASIEARVERVVATGEIMLAHAVIHAVTADGGTPRLIATVCGRFLVGTFPGGAMVQSAAESGAGDRVSTATSLAALMALQPGAAPGTLVLPANPALVGARSLPAVHGGFIAAALEASGAAHVASEPGWAAIDFEVSYIRPALATAPLLIVPQVLRSSRRSLLVSAQALQGDDARLIATAKMLYFRGAGPSVPQALRFDNWIDDRFKAFGEQA